MDDLPKFIGFIPPPDIGDEMPQPHHRPLVHLGQLVIRDSMHHGVKIVNIAQHKSAGIADFSVGLDELLQNVLGNSQVFLIVL